MAPLSRTLFFFSMSLRRRLSQAASKVPALALGVPAGLVFLLASAGVLTRFGEGVAGMQQMHAAHVVRRAGDLSGELFNELAHARQLLFNQQTAHLDLAIDCVARNSGFWAPPAGGSAESDAGHLAARLCQSDIGASLLSEIDEWNGHVAMVAVRDDGDRERDCPNGEKPQGYLPSGCHPPKWFAGVPSGEGSASVAILPGTPPPELFGFLATAQHEGFGDWARFDASGFRDGTMVLERRFDDAQTNRGEMTVDVAGDVEEASWVDGGGQEIGDIGVGTLSCEEAQSAETCAAEMARPAGALMPRAHRLRVGVPPAGATLVVKVRPISVVEASVAALAKAHFSPPELGEEPITEASHLRFTRHIVVECTKIDDSQYTYDDAADSVVHMQAPVEEPTAGQVRECTLLWDVSEPATQPTSGLPPGTLTFSTSGATKVALTETYASKGANEETRIRASGDARRLGLLPVVGFDDHDPSSLLGQLRPRVASGGDLAVDLTIDADLQAHTYAAVTGLMRREPAFSDIFEKLPAAFDAKRRAAIVLIDGGIAGADGSGFDGGTGRILAAATWPQVSAFLSEWDLLALEAYPRSPTDPLAARGWARNDRFNAPGSTFKPLVALAAIDKAARGDETLADMLGLEPPARPGLGKADIARVLGNAYGFGWDAAALIVDVFAGRRGAKTAEVHNDLKEQVSRAAIARGGKPPLVNLTGAMAFSNNVWFARLALAIDENAVSEMGPDGARAEYRDTKHNGDLAIARMAQRLWPEAAADLAPGLSPPLGRFSRLRATPIQVSETDPRGPRLLYVALNGFGQGGVQATPLALASIMASIATGHVVLPRLTADDSPARMAQASELLDPAEVGGRPLDRARAATMLEGLRDALAAVVRLPGATAYQAFLSKPKMAMKLHGKTGTAQIGERYRGDPEARYNTVWFEGWLDGLDAPGYRDRRIAFACMVTLADRGAGTAGGSVCAPLMRKLFESIEEDHLASVAALGGRGPHDRAAAVSDGGNRAPQ